jgi:hypothetical protein
MAGRARPPQRLPAHGTRAKHSIASAEAARGRQRRLFKATFPLAFAPAVDRCPTLSNIDAIMSLGKVEKAGRRDVVFFRTTIQRPDRKSPALLLDRDDPGTSPAQ